MMVWKSNFNDFDNSQKEANKGKYNLYLNKATAPRSAYSHSNSNHPLYTEVSAAVPPSSRNKPAVAVEPPIKNGPRGLEIKKNIVSAGLVGPSSSGKGSPEIINVGSAIFGRTVFKTRNNV